MRYRIFSNSEELNILDRISRSLLILKILCFVNIVLVILLLVFSNK